MSNTQALSGVKWEFPESIFKKLTLDSYSKWSKTSHMLCVDPQS